MKTENILGIKVNDISLAETVGIVTDWLKLTKKHYVVTPNPEFIMAAQTDLEFRQVLNQADLAIPDGKGLRLSGGIEHTTTGIDLMEKLWQILADQGFKIGFLGGQKGVAKKSAERLRMRFPKLKIVYAEAGPVVDKNGRETALSSSNKYRKLPVDILFVGFGHMKQEKWIAHNLDKLPVRVAIGVGGAFDYLSGKVMRAPALVRKLGLEWLFRLILQPWRINRQLVLAKFIWLIILHRFQKP